MRGFCQIKLVMMLVFLSLSQSWAVSVWALIHIPYTSVGPKTNYRTEKAGDVLTLAIPVFTSLATVLYEDSVSGLEDLTGTLIVTFATTFALKRVVGKTRPNGACCSSFPSGHSSSSFATAAFVHARYQNIWSVPMYLMAAYVGYSRVYAYKHYPEDVAAGAALGVVNAFLATELYKYLKI